MEKANYENDTLDGVRTLYFVNGEVEVRENYRMGQYEGSFEAYYENGQLENTTAGRFVGNKSIGDSGLTLINNRQKDQK